MKLGTGNIDTKGQEWTGKTEGMYLFRHGIQAFRKTVSVLDDSLSSSEIS